MTADATVFVVDDEWVVCKVVSLLIESAGLDVQTFPSAEAFLAHDLPDRPSCLVLDIHMPGMSGLDLQEELNRAGQRIPIIFITGHGDAGTRDRALKAGAVDFLQKPFQDQELLDAIHCALKAVLLQATVVEGGVLLTKTA